MVEYTYFGDHEESYECSVDSTDCLMRETKSTLKMSHCARLWRGVPARKDVAMDRIEATFARPRLNRDVRAADFNGERWFVSS